MSEKPFQKRMTRIVERVGGVSELHRRSGVGERSIRNYLNGDTEPKGDVIAKLAAGAGVRAEWLFAGVEPMAADFAGSGFIAEVKGYGLEESPPEYGAELKRTRYVYIPMYDVAAGAARGGRLAVDERIVGELAFKEDWIRREIRAKPEDLRLIHVEGDSMEPDLRAGDIVLLDTTDTLARREGIYVIRLDGALLVKNLQRLPGGVVKVVSRNPTYEPFTVTVDEVEHPNGFGVIGRVVWACRRF